MRYQTYRGDDLVAESDHADLAITGASSVNAPLRVLDTWTSEYLSFTVPAPKLITVTGENPYGLPLQYIKWELLKFVTQGTSSPKIPLIKLVRELTGMGLGESKSVIDNLENQVRMEERQRPRRDNY